MPDSKNFTLLHNRTVWINETAFPSVMLSIEPDDPEDLCASQLDFIWEVLSYGEMELTFKLNFTNPTCVSSSSMDGDTLAISFHDQRLFMDTRGKLIEPGVTIKKKIVR